MASGCWLLFCGRLGQLKGRVVQLALWTGSLNTDTNLSVEQFVLQIEVQRECLFPSSLDGSESYPLEAVSILFPLLNPSSTLTGTVTQGISLNLVAIYLSHAAKEKKLWYLSHLWNVRVHTNLQLGPMNVRQLVPPLVSTTSLGGRGGL